ncbi:MULTISPECIES: ABC transporter permease [unclassified Rhizobium]|uniref:ABC transporter permease n=1 Tax=unclassified Rhizobium TaxID=2613769 RepID=UPI00146AFCDD|nr:MULTISPECIES: ABC transporter permease [unclassified Rhizobium]MBD9445018.1 ABC transporter permease [Rhizobium sp. RHZ01]MBD9452719.1 ABC transporter permease [Rhizobium sp. RHZ02]NMN69714.1 putative spermidine/putrescine transport system permease protein [Rhizobium sp. 57MFTsu3.2]
MRSSGGEKFVYGLCAVLFALTVLVLYAPILVNALLSVVPRKAGSLHWAEAGGGAYLELFGNVDLMQSLFASVIVAVSASVLSSVIAVVMALYLDSRFAFGRRAIETLIYLPFIMPSMITGLALLIYFTALKVPLSLATVTLGHTIFVLAIAYRLTSVRLTNLSPSLREASMDLGANGWQTFRHIIFPHLQPAILSGVLFAAAISIDETLITLFLSGDRMTLPIRLWSMLRVGFTQEINALVTLVIAGTLVVALFGLRVWKKDGKLEF